LERHHAAHANFCQYVPITLLLMAAAELSDANALAIHALGIATVIGRAAHAKGINDTTGDFRFRILGMQLTFAALAIGAIINFILAGLN
ncbi:MAG: MAPEG family protein, partial [Pseudomonadota bacterium]